MTIQITQPEVEAIIHQRMESGLFKDAEEVVLQALRASPEPQFHPPAAGSLEQVFAKIRGLADDLDFSRNPSATRTVTFE